MIEFSKRVILSAAAASLMALALTGCGGDVKDGAGAASPASTTATVGVEGGTVQMQDIFRFVQDGTDEQGKAFGHFESTGVRPAFMGRLESAGVKLPANLFAHRTLGK